MRYRLVAAVFAWCLVAAAQTMTVEQLFTFVKSSGQLIEEGKMTDKELANYLAKSKLSERLDDRTIEQMQSAGIGPRTLEALRQLRDNSQSLAAGKPIDTQPKPQGPPPPNSQEQAAIIDDVRHYALSYTKSLPDFICTQVTRRYAAAAPGTRGGGSPGSEPSWRSLDTLTVRLSFFDQKEDYKLILVNNSVTNQSYQSVGGATTSGDFGSMMKDIFEPATRTRFEWDHWATLRSRLTMAFSYSVALERSEWSVGYDNSHVKVAYRGLVYVDPKTHEVMRVTLDAVNLPADFPVRQTEIILDYEYQDLSGRTFLLPLKARSVMLAGDFTTRNDTEFRLYRKYSAESEIKFDADTETPPPLPEDETTESPATEQK